MVKVTFVGLGRIGFKVLTFLLKLREDVEALALDIDPKKEELVRGFRDVRFVKVVDKKNIVNASKGADLAVVALPSSVAFEHIKSLIEEGIDVVDVSYITEDPYSLASLAEERGCLYIPDAGFAPGFSNLLAGEFYRMLGELDLLEILVGGIPERPIPPIGYSVTWCAEDLLEEYVRPARVVKDGAVVKVDTLGEFVECEVEGVGILEGFYSDGLRTLVRNVKAKNMHEITLRWPGHLLAVKLLRDLGFLSKEKVSINGNLIEPLKFTAAIFERNLRLNVNDIAILIVKAMKGNSGYLASAILKGTSKEPATVVFTSAVLAVTANLAVSKSLGKGVKPLEELYEFKGEYVKFLTELGCRVEVRPFKA